MPFPINTMSIAKYEKATDESLRGSIQSTLLVKLTVQTQHQDSLRGCLLMTKSPSKFQLSLVCVQKRKECDHVHSALCFDKQGHMIDIIDVLCQNKLSHIFEFVVYLFTCFCSKRHISKTVPLINATRQLYSEFDPM